MRVVGWSVITGVERAWSEEKLAVLAWNVAAEACEALSQTQRHWRSQGVIRTYRTASMPCASELVIPSLSALRKSITPM